MEEVAEWPLKALLASKGSCHDKGSVGTSTSLVILVCALQLRGAFSGRVCRARPSLSLAPIHMAPIHMAPIHMAPIHMAPRLTGEPLTTAAKMLPAVFGLTKAGALKRDAGRLGSGGCAEAL